MAKKFPVSSGSSGGGYDVTAFQMITDDISVLSVENAWKMADRREVFDKLFFNFTGDTLSEKTSSGAFDSATDVSTIRSYDFIKDYINASDYLITLAESGVESADFIDYDPDMSTMDSSFTLFNVSPQNSNPRNLFMKRDGTKAYMYGNDEIIYAYDLSTAWDVSSSSVTYNSETFDTSTQVGTSNRAIAISKDGTKLFALDASDIYAYDLSTAWDVSSATYNSETFDFSAQVSNSNDVSFLGDGTKMYIGDGTDIYAYDLSTAWDVSSATYNSETVSVSYTKFHVSELGGFLYTLRTSLSPIITKYPLLITGDISSLGSGQEDNVTVPEDSDQGIFVSPDAEHFILLESGSDDRLRSTTISSVSPKLI